MQFSPMSQFDCRPDVLDDVTPAATSMVPAAGDRVRPVRGLSAQLRRRATKSSQLRERSKSGSENTNPNVDDDAELVSDDESGKRVEVEPGLSYTVHASKMDRYQKKLYRLQPQSRAPQKQVLSKEETLAQHSVSVVPAFTGQIKQRGTEKREYVARQMLAEVGPAQVRAREFWITMFMLVVCFWIRIYAHYFGQWLFLQAKRIPVSSFMFSAVTVNLNYQATLLLTEEEIAVVCFGPILVLLLFVLMCAVAWLSKRLLVS